MTDPLISAAKAFVTGGQWWATRKSDSTESENSKASREALCQLLGLIAETRLFPLERLNLRHGMTLCDHFPHTVFHNPQDTQRWEAFGTDEPGVAGGRVPRSAGLQSPLALDLHSDNL